MQKCREDIAQAMREEYISGTDGKPVRAKHAARISEGNTQTTLWADIRSAPRRLVGIWRLLFINVESRLLASAGS